MFGIDLYRNNSELNRMDKDLETGLTIYGNLKENTSIMNPVFIVETPIDVLSNYNYVYIYKFSRYYFITDMVTINNALTEIYLHVDVLMSFKREIRGNQAITKRQENDWNLYLNDGSFRVYQYKTVGTYKFPTGFPTDNDLVLAVAGRSNIT